RDRMPSEPQVTKPTRRPPKSFTNSLRSLIGSVEEDGGTALDQFERMSAGAQQQDDTSIGSPSVAPEQGREFARERLAENTSQPPAAQAENTGGQNSLGVASQRKQDFPPEPTAVPDRRPPARINPITVNRGELKPMDLATTHTGSEHKLYTFFYE